MDFLGPDSSDEDTPVTAATTGGVITLPELTACISEYFTAIVKSRLRCKNPEFSSMDLRLLLIIPEESIMATNMKLLISRLHTAKFTDVHIVTQLSNDTPKNSYDIVISTPSTRMLSVVDDAKIFDILVAGGQLMIFTETPKASLDRTTKWITESLKQICIDSTNYISAILTKRYIQCNTGAALYWATQFGHIENEATIVSDVTVALTVQERMLGILSERSHVKAVDALKNRGVCIIRGIFDIHKSALETLGSCVLADFDSAKSELLRRGIDLTKPGQGGPMINNYHELSMREAFRVDIRNGIRMRSSVQLECGLDGSRLDVPIAQQYDIIRNDPRILSILQEAMNPDVDSIPAEYVGGNWGRWNFGGDGPEAPPPPPLVGQIGAVVTMPGCLDQTIHADTEHLFDHVQLPGHYFNLFTPGLSIDSNSDEFVNVGQTAFIVDSHQIAVSARLMNTGKKGENELERKMIRPMLEYGDALLFDCRILHFGLANSSSYINRPILYINYHHKSFRDPKNWNDHEKLFP